MKTPYEIIYNLLRQRSAELLFEQTLQRGVGVLARLPFASGLLSGKFNAETQFAADDHRHFNRDRAAFDEGETFGGLDDAQGLRAVEALRAWLPAGMSLPQLVLR